MTTWPEIVFGGLAAAAVAQVISGRISRSVKISEFRQKWIDALRDDVALYLGATHKWIRKHEEINDTVTSGEREEKEREELLPIWNEALIILSRIKLRINPHKNEHKKDDDAFLSALDKLIDVGKLEPSETSTIELSWQNAAREAIDSARKLLKREWEVTKRPSQWL